VTHTRVPGLIAEGRVLRDLGEHALIKTIVETRTSGLELRSPSDGAIHEQVEIHLIPLAASDRSVDRTL
jgi:hypothetical protein